MATDDKARAKGANIESWWMDEVRQIVDDRKEDLGESLVELGAALAKAVGRADEWNHGSVSRFLNERNVTTDMADAFAVLFGIPKPIFQARSREEALAMQQVARRYDDRAATPDQKRKLSKVDQKMAAAEVDAKDQSRGVGSVDEVRAGRGRRSGRTGRAD